MYKFVFDFGKFDVRKVTVYAENLEEAKEKLEGLVGGLYVDLLAVEEIYQGEYECRETIRWIIKKNL